MSLCRFKSKKKLVMLKTNIKSILKPHSMVFVLFSYQFLHWGICDLESLYLIETPNIYIYIYRFDQELASKTCLLGNPYQLQFLY
jgi:hypothetical protein